MRIVGNSPRRAHSYAETRPMPSALPASGIEHVRLSPKRLSSAALTDSRTDVRSAAISGWGLSDGAGVTRVRAGLIITILSIA
jgi:hypothetical protein